MLAMLKEAEDPIRESEVDEIETEYPLDAPVQQAAMPSQPAIVKPLAVNPSIIPTLASMDEVVKPVKKILVMPAAQPSASSIRKPSVPIVPVSSVQLNDKCTFLGNCTCPDCRPDLHKKK
jgi:hypothetical protein